MISNNLDPDTAARRFASAALPRLCILYVNKAKPSLAPRP